MRVALSRDRTVALTGDGEGGDADFVLSLATRDAPDGGALNASLASAGGRILFADAYALGDDEPEVRAVGVRLAAMVASPGSGLVGRHLMEGARYKPVESLTRTECYAHGHDCINLLGRAR